MNIYSCSNSDNEYNNGKVSDVKVGRNLSPVRFPVIGRATIRPRKHCCGLCLCSADNSDTKIILLHFTEMYSACNSTRVHILQWCRAHSVLEGSDAGSCRYMFCIAICHCIALWSPVYKLWCIVAPMWFGLSPTDCHCTATCSGRWRSGKLGKAPACLDFSLLEFFFAMSPSSGSDSHFSK